MDNRIHLEITKRTDPRLLQLMSRHYSKPKGFVGRSIAYAILYDDLYYGHIVAGSATRFLPGRNEFFGEDFNLQVIVNNIFYHIEKVNGCYPARWFTVKVVTHWREKVQKDWLSKYGISIIGFESLVELPRLGVLYLRDGWQEVGVTKGYTCKRVAGRGTDSWTGKRVWDTTNLKPKLVFARRI